MNLTAFLVIWGPLIAAFGWLAVLITKKSTIRVWLLFTLYCAAVCWWWMFLATHMD